MIRTVTIELEIEGPDAAITAAVNAVLDRGALQDAINEYEHDDGPVRVSSAYIVYGEVRK